MRIVKKPSKKVMASEEEIMEETPMEEGAADVEELVEIEPEATELLFETEDVAELIAEVTESEVVVETDDETEEITFTVDGEPFVVEPEGTEEILESSRRVLKGKKSVKASRKPARRVARRRSAK